MRTLIKEEEILNNELEKFLPSEIQEMPAFQQSAEKIYNIDKVENINVYHAAPAIIDQGFPSPEGVLDTSYYHLIVHGDFLETAIIMIKKERALSSPYTDDSIRSRYAQLTPDITNELLRYPVLIMPECNDYYAKASSEQFAYVGKIEKIRIENVGVKIKLIIDREKPIPLKQITTLGFELNLLGMDVAITELNHSHWALKPVNLTKELTEANIDVRGNII